MTSKSLFFKLLRENVKRRAWAIALAVLGFFFSLPINLALTMENAIKTKFWRYNDYEQLVFAEGVSEAEKLAKILEIKTQIVLDSVKFGNGLIAFLIIVAAVVIGFPAFPICTTAERWTFTTASRCAGRFSSPCSTWADF